MLATCFNNVQKTWQIFRFFFKFWQFLKKEYAIDFFNFWKQNSPQKSDGRDITNNVL